MKRGLVALVLFCFCIAFSVFCSEKSKTELKNAAENINEIRSLCESGKDKPAVKKAEDLKDEWQNEYFFIKISLNNSEIKEIESAVISLPSVIKNGDNGKAAEKCETVLFEIEYLIKCEELSLDNIF